MSGLPGHDIVLALLDACGIPAADATAVTFRSAVNEITTIDVTYLMCTQGNPSVLLEATARFQQVFDTGDGTP